MARAIQVQIGEFRPAAVFDSGGYEVKKGSLVIVDLDRSSEYGRVVADVTPHGADARGPSLQGKILRKVTEGDMRQIENNRGKARDAFNVGLSKVNEMKLDMHILAAEYSFDATKIMFYFTAEGRVDFRELVKELARVFRVRIELKQIGVRDRAKMVKGYGVCGEPFCCSTFLKDFSQLSIKMAKEQALPLNPSKISGVCGRIKCCMAYEVNVYKELNKGLPKMGAKIQMADGGRGRVINLDVLKRIVVVDMGEGRIVKVPVPAGEDSKELLQQLTQSDAMRPGGRGNDRGRSDRRPDAKPEDAAAPAAEKTEARPEAKPEGRPERRPDGRPDRRPDRRNDRRPERRPDGRPDQRQGSSQGRPQSQPQQNRPQAQPARPAENRDKPENKGPNRPEHHQRGPRPNNDQRRDR